MVTSFTGANNRLLNPSTVDNYGKQIQLEKVLELDPDCFNNSNPPVIIKNFTGDITFYTTTEYIEEYDEERDIVTITGTGTQNFCSEFYDKLIEKGYQLDD